ncbi:MAG: acyltransferase [Cyclobacteriaceae bacterium]|nr:acyltransferase [Cyclobacteriaceae bacterium]
MKIKSLDLHPLSGQHRIELDGLRGLAITLVLLFHLFPYLIISKIGWIGVDLFFVLSGFLITGILLDSIDKPHFWRNFIVRRSLRIFPLYFSSLLLYNAIAFWSPTFASIPAVSYSYFVENQWWYWLYASNFKVFLEGEWLPVVIFNPLWSLSIEEQFYLIWPFFLLFFKDKKLHIVIAGLMVLVVVIRISFFFLGFEPISIYVFTASRLDPILVGSLISVIIRIPFLRTHLEKYGLAYFIVSLVLFAIFILTFKTINPLAPSVQVVGYSLIAFLFGCLLLLVIDSSGALRPLTRPFRSPMLVFFGKYSYGLYVFHWPVYVLLHKLLYTEVEKYIPYDLGAYLISSFLILLLTIGVSLLSWIVLEKRFLKLKDKLAPNTST